MSITYYENQFSSLQNEFMNNLRENKNKDISANITNLTRISDIIDTLSNNIRHDIKQKTQENDTFNDKLRNIQNENIKLRRTLDGLKQETLGSEKMFKDVKLLYNQKLIFNWVLTSALFGTVYVYMKKK